MVELGSQMVRRDVVGQIDDELVDRDRALHLLHVDAHDVAAALADDARHPAERPRPVGKLHA